MSIEERMIFHGKEVRKKIPSLVRNVRRFEWNTKKNIYRRVRNSGKQVLFAVENKYKIFGSDECMYVRRKTGEDIGNKKVFVQRSNMVVVA
jgi:uncharacterized membrane protein